MMIREYIKVSEYAEIKGIHYRTAQRHFNEGLIEGYRNTHGRIFLKNPLYKKEETDEKNDKAVILYARVSSSTNKKSLDGQIERMRLYAVAKGYNIVGEYKELASGLNDNRLLLNKIFNRDDYSILLVEHKDRLTRFGFNYLVKLFAKLNIKVEVINQVENKDQEIIDDFVSIITSFCGKIYGSKRKAKTEKIIKELTNEN